ncbi:putative Pectate trisaccharide-lyase [Glarea lozoyensis 74030]|uniref:Putative Pectate trisaccharide-lyase n=1 Tax=Glarea lozoyensis (strain ATCC 74030 / MF5533) TaxID=1104152 RepID=H0EZ74_GLAL7|nr:putative Pectate trisaccharide-lyase [Glarea lozoyensis 74030]
MSRAETSANEPLIIRIQGILKADPKGFEVPVTSDKTIIGVGSDSGINGGGFGIKKQRNVIIRNLRVSGTYNPKDYPGKGDDFDGIQIDNSTNIWIDYVHFSQMADGLIDLRADTDYVTVSRSIISQHNKAFGIGWTQNVISKVTINDCFFNSTNVRGPSADNLKMGHLYNNYYRNITGYGIYSRGASSLLVENTYFEDAHDPIVAGPNGTIKSNWLKFKNCTGETHLNVKPESVFKATDYYAYSLRDPYDIPIDIPYFGGPQTTIGI